MTRCAYLRTARRFGSIDNYTDVSVGFLTNGVPYMAGRYGGSR